MNAPANIARPVRLRLSRTKGFDLQELSRATNGLPAVSVARPTRWGNPIHVGMFHGYDAADAVRDYRLWLVRELRRLSFDGRFGRPPRLEDIRSDLAERNLACWCAPDAPCHADVLLELANMEQKAA